MRYRGFFSAFLSATLYGSIGIFVKNGISDDFGPIDLVMLQMVVSIVLMFFVGVIWYKRDLKLEKGQLKRLLVLGGLANTAILVCNYQSYKYLSIAVATVILYTYPAWVAIASAVMFKVRVSTNKVVAIIGTFFGCLLIINILSPKVMASISLIGLFYAFLAALSFTFFNLYSAKILHDTKPVVVTFYNALFTFLVLLVFNFDFVNKIQYVKMDLLANAAVLAVLCGIVPSILYYIAIKEIGSIPVSIIGSMEIPIAALLSWLVLKDALVPVQIVGIVISVVSVSLLKFEPNEVKIDVKNE